MCESQHVAVKMYINYSFLHLFYNNSAVIKLFGIPK